MTDRPMIIMSSLSLIPEDDDDPLAPYPEQDPLFPDASPSSATAPIPDCLICDSKSKLSIASKRAKQYSQVMTSVIRYPDTFFNLRSTRIKTENTDNTKGKEEQFVFCNKCGQRLQQIRGILDKLGILHQRVIHFQEEIINDVHACLTKAQAGEGDANLLRNAREFVLLELNSIDRDTEVTEEQDDSRNYQQRQTASISTAKAIPRCSVRLSRLAKQKMPAAVIEDEQEPAEQDPLVSIKEEPDFLDDPLAEDFICHYLDDADEDDAQNDEASVPSESDSSVSDPGESDNSEDEEFILPTKTPNCQPRTQAAPSGKRRRDRPPKSNPGVESRVRYGKRACKHPGCDFKAMRSSQLARHVLESHFQSPSALYLCWHCGSFFPGSLPALEAHLEGHNMAVEQHQTSNRLQCPYCRRSFTTLSNVRSHCRRHHPKKQQPTRVNFPQLEQKPESRFSCSDCNIIFKTLHDLQDHYRVHHPSEPLPTRIRNREKEHPFECQHCFSKFTMLRNIKMHFKLKHPMEPLPSRADFPHLVEEKKLRREQRAEAKKRKKKKPSPSFSLLDAPESTRTCPHCAQVFVRVTEKSFQNHMALHTKPYKCTVDSCDGAFASSIALKYHCVRFHPELEVHPGFPCPHCPFLSNRPETLKTHIRAKHEVHLMVPCPEPGCSFRTPNATRLVQHRERVHEGKKRFLCTECGKGFYFQRKLVIHSRIHTGERPFACSVCEKRFYNRDKMRTHEQTHGPDRPHVCGLCGMRFPTYNNLYGHNTSWHKGGVERIGVQPTRKGKYN